MKNNSKKKILVCSVALLFAVSAGYACFNWCRVKGTKGSVAAGNAKHDNKNIPLSCSEECAATATNKTTVAHNHPGSTSSPFEAPPLNSSSSLLLASAGNKMESISLANAHAGNKTSTPAKASSDQGSTYYAHFAKDAEEGKQHKGSVSFAPEIGINLNGTIRNQSQNGLKNGFHLGGIANICLGDHFALQPGVMFIKKGYETNHTFSTGHADGNITQTVALSYIEMPLNLVYKFGDWKDGRFIAGGGPYISYLAHSYQHTSTVITAEYEGNTGNNTAPDATPKGTTDLRKLDLGLNAFIGCEMPGGFYMKGGVDLGLIGTQKNANNNLGVIMSIGYLIP
jgi:hypothetical protein